MIENVLSHLGVNVHDFKNTWTIKFYSLENTDPRFFDHFRTTSGQKININMPSGVTGKKEITFWLHDSRDKRMNMENSSRVQHEVCHAVLLDKYGTRGSVDWVKEVHTTGGIIKTAFWYWKRFFWDRFPLVIIDIRLLLK